MTKPPIIEISWVDSYGLDEGWHHMSSDVEGRTLVTSGYLVTETDEYVVIATTIDPSTETYGSGIAVLKRCILSRHVVSE